MRRFVCVCLALVFAACGEVSPQDPDGGNPGDPDAQTPTPDSAPADACTESLTASAQFTIDNIVGNGASSLDQLLNHPNGFILSFAAWDTVKAAESNGPGGEIVFLTGVQSAEWTMDYTGQDGDFLDNEVAPFLTRGLAVQSSIFQLGNDGTVFLYVLPEDTQQHVYMDLRCNGLSFEQDVGGYPVLDSVTANGCSITFFDFRANTQKNIIAQQTVTFELSYTQCTP